MIAEGNETPGGEPGDVVEGRSRRSEGDLLAERRARRAAESGEHVLTLRAEAAEATVRTLETHVASLQERLRESEQERRLASERFDAEPERAIGGRAVESGTREPLPARDPLERELQRVAQREYAEQRLRVEAEDRCGEVERESRAEIERLGRRVSASEREAQSLGVRLESAQRELDEAEQAATTERAALLRTERVLRSRLTELEVGAVEMHGLLEAERAARRRAEYLLDALRAAQRGALSLLGGLADTISRLRDAALPATTEPAPASPPSTSTSTLALASAPAMAHGPGQSPAQDPAALASAPAQAAGGAAPVAQASEVPPAQSDGGEMAEALAAAVERLRAKVDQQAEEGEASVAKRPPHKHSMSLITRTRLAYRRRRERRKQRSER